jgi:hypothetical protein
MQASQPPPEPKQHHEQLEEQRLLLALRREIARQGGCARLFSLINHCPTLRPLLGDRGLLAFVRAHPDVFHVDRRTISTTTLRATPQVCALYDPIASQLCTRCIMDRCVVAGGQSRREYHIRHQPAG